MNSENKLQHILNYGYEPVPTSCDTEENKCEKCSTVSALYIAYSLGMEDCDETTAKCLDCTYDECVFEENYWDEQLAKEESQERAK